MASCNEQPPIPLSFCSRLVTKIVAPVASRAAAPTINEKRTHPEKLAPLMGQRSPAAVGCCFLAALQHTADGLDDFIYRYRAAPVGIERRADVDPKIPE